MFILKKFMQNNVEQKINKFVKAYEKKLKVKGKGNLVPRVSHVTTPGARAERPWLGLVTCLSESGRLQLIIDVCYAGLLNGV